jgi:hypothetical protein
MVYAGPDETAMAELREGDVLQILDRIGIAHFDAP